MINVIITTEKESLFKELLPSVNMQAAEEPGKLSFCLPADQFKVFYQELKSLGYKDPQKLMNWSNAKRSKQCHKLSLPLLISEEEPINKAQVIEKVKALTT